MIMELKGACRTGEFTSKKTYPGAKFAYTVHLPEDVNEDGEYGLLVTHDGLNMTEVLALQDLAAAGEAPVCVSVGIMPGKLPSTISTGYERGLRMNTYDMYSPDYANFLADELIPFIRKKYGVNISASPDLHMISGGSSGGISAWNAAWFRNDMFRRVYMSSPSFLSMGKGDELLNLMRKMETKPIRVFVDYSENEPDEYFGSSYCAAEACIRALQFAGYDMMSEYHPGEGHCSRVNDPEHALKRMRFLWNGWKDAPVARKALSKRMKEVVSENSSWEAAARICRAKEWAVSDGDFTAEGTYRPKGSMIWFEKANGEKVVAADGFEEITAVAVSSDKWRLYIADKRRACIYAATIWPDGSLDKPYVHCALHQKTDFTYPGAFSICVDNQDRIYAATEIGIQTVRSFGLIDAILEHPENLQTEKVALSADGYLYARTEEGSFRRKLNNKQPDDLTVAAKPFPVGYYDD